MIVLRGLLWVAWTYELLLLAVYPRPDLWSVGEDSRIFWNDAILTTLFTVRRLDVTWTTIWRDLYLNLRKNVHFDVPYGVLHLNSSVTIMVTKFKWNRQSNPLSDICKNDLATWTQSCSHGGRSESFGMTRLRSMGDRNRMTVTHRAAYCWL